MEKQSTNKEGDKKMTSDGADPEENSSSESSDETDSSFDEDDVSEDFVPLKSTRRRQNASRRGRRKVMAKDPSPSGLMCTPGSTRRTRLSQKLEEGIPLHLNFEMQNAYRILTHLMSDANQAYNWPFMDDMNLNLREYRNYSVIVEKPMCFNKVKTKLLAKEYNSITEVIRDVRLVFENCYRFHGASHTNSKKGFRLELMLEQKLSQLSRKSSDFYRDLRDKTAISVTSPELVKGVNLKDLEGKLDHRSPAEASTIMACVKHANDIEEEEDRKMLQQEKEKEKDPAHLEVLEWEKTFIGDNLTSLKAMWELAQIGHFLFLAQTVLNIPEVSQFELERAFFMPQASSLFSIIMTALLSSPKQRNKLANKPPMPYRIWHERLKVKVQAWYKLYYTKERNLLKVLNIIGIEPPFFRLMGDVSPLEKRPFHELELYERVWIVKSLCDFCLHSHKSVQEAIFMGDPLDHREVVLGEDTKGNQYLHFPQFCGQDLRVYRQAPFPEPTAPDFSCPPIVKEVLAAKPTIELPSQKSQSVKGDIKNTEEQKSSVSCPLESSESNDAVSACEKENVDGKLCSGNGFQDDRTNGSNLENNSSLSANDSLNNSASSKSENGSFVNGTVGDRSTSTKDCFEEKEHGVAIVNGDVDSKNCSGSAIDSSSDLEFSSENHQSGSNENDHKPKLIMKFKKEVSDKSANDLDANSLCEGKRRRRSRNDVFSICSPSAVASEEGQKKKEPTEDLKETTNANESLKLEKDCNDVEQKELRSTVPEKEKANHAMPSDSKSCKKETKQEDRPKKSPAKVSDCNSLESTWIGARKKGRRGRKSKATPMVISYTAVAPKPNIEEFELVVQNLDSLRALTDLFVEKEPPPQRTRKKKEPQQKSNACEKALHKRLTNLQEELEAWELTLMQTTKSTRLRLKKEWDDYQLKAAQKEEEECNDIWGSEEDEDEEIRESSLSSSDSEDEYEDLGDATSFRIQHLRQCTRKKRARGDDEQSSVGVSSENSNSSEAFHLSVSSRGRIRKLRRLENYEDQPAYKVSPKPKRQFIVLNGIQPDQRNMLEAHRIQNSTQDAKMQYQWETMRQQLLGEKLKKVTQRPLILRAEQKPCTSGINTNTIAITTPTTTAAATPRLLPHYGERAKTKKMDDPITLAKEPGTPSHHFQHVLMSQPSFGSMKSMKSGLTSDDSFFEDPSTLGFPHYIPDFRSTDRPYRPPPEMATPAAKKKVTPQPRIIRSESKNIGKRLLQTSYTAPGILKTTVGSKMTAPETTPATPTVSFRPQPTTAKVQSQVLRLQLPPSLAGNSAALQQKRMVLVPVKDQKGGSKYILKVLPTAAAATCSTGVTNTIVSSTVMTSASNIASTSGCHLPQITQNNVQREYRISMPVGSTPPPLGPISQAFQKTSPPQPNISPTQSPVVTSIASEPLAVIVPQRTAVLPQTIETQPHMELVTRPMISEIVLPTQQQMVISQPMVVPCAMQLQTSGNLLGQQQLVCTSDFNGLLQLGKQLVITQPSTVTTSNNIVLFTSNNQVISSTLNLPGS